MGLNVKSAGKLFLRLLISLGILLWLFLKVDLQKLLSSFAQIPLYIWFLAFILYLISQIISAFRWYVIGKNLSFDRPFFTYLKYYFVGMFFNLFLPSAIGGDVLKVFFLSQGENIKLKASYSVFLDRAFGLWAMFLIGSFAVLFDPLALPKRWEVIIVASGIAITVISIIAPFMHTLTRKLMEKPSNFSFFNKILHYLESILLFWKRPKALLISLGLSFILQLCGMSAVFLLGCGLKLGLPLSFYYSALPVISLITILPISLSGIGVREGGFVYFLSLKGVPIEKALTLSLGVFTIQSLCALIGGFGYMAGLHKQVIKDV